MGCFQYGTADCDKLYGEAARMCQEYRQRKADAEMRNEATQLLKDYRQCIEKYQEQPDKQKEYCSVYTQALHEIELKTTTK